MSKQISQEINGKNVVITLLGAKDGLQMAQKLASTIVPALSGMIAGGQSSETFASAAKDLIMSLDEVDLYQMTEKLFNLATVNDFPIKPNDYFSGNYGEYIDFMAFALEANFKSFFSASRLSSLNFPGLKA